MLQLDDISIKFKNFSLDNISMEIGQNECVSIIGPTGSGKSCILRAVAGIYSIAGGKITMGGNPIHMLPPEDRNIGLVFQDNALFPHLNAYENIAFGLKVRKVDKKEIDKKVSEYAELFHITHILKRSIHRLSGGEKQRISLARALIMEPSVLLLDEPFSALDRLIHEKLLAEFKTIFKLKKMMVLHVTHDQTEASILSDRIAIIKNGKILQLDTVDNIFKRPNSKFVADFVNTQNIFKGKVVQKNGTNEILYKSITIQCNGLERFEDVHFCIRPEYVGLYKEKPKKLSSNVFPAIVKNVTTAEAISRITVGLNGNGTELLSYKIVGNNKKKEHRVGENIFVHLNKNNIHLFYDV